MKKAMMILVILSLVVVGIMGSGVIASAAPTEKTEGFICPVLGGKAGMHGMSQKIFPIAGGYFTVAGPDVMVPAHATNEGWPGLAGSYLMPGDVGYTAIWNYDNAPPD